MYNNMKNETFFSIFQQSISFKKVISKFFPTSFFPSLSLSYFNRNENSIMKNKNPCRDCVSERESCLDGTHKRHEREINTTVSTLQEKVFSCVYINFLRPIELLRTFFLSHTHTVVYIQFPSFSYQQELFSHSLVVTFFFTAYTVKKKDVVIERL